MLSSDEIVVVSHIQEDGLFINVLLLANNHRGVLKKLSRNLSIIVATNMVPLFHR
jgi:hypothetical protein